MKSIKENPRRSCIESKTKEDSYETRLLNPRLGRRPRRRVYTEDNSQKSRLCDKHEVLWSPDSGSQVRFRGSSESSHSEKAPIFDKGLEERSDMYNMCSWEKTNWTPANSSQSPNPECLSLTTAPCVSKCRSSPKRRCRRKQQTIATVNSTCRHHLETHQGKGRNQNSTPELNGLRKGDAGMQMKQSTRRLSSRSESVQTYASPASVIPNSPGTPGPGESLSRQRLFGPGSAIPSQTNQALKSKRKTLATQTRESKRKRKLMCTEQVHVNSFNTSHTLRYSRTNREKVAQIQNIKASRRAKKSASQALMQQKRCAASESNLLPIVGTEKVTTVYSSHHKMKKRRYSEILDAKTNTIANATKKPRLLKCLVPCKRKLKGNHNERSNNEITHHDQDGYSLNHIMQHKIRKLNQLNGPALEPFELSRNETHERLPWTKKRANSLSLTRDTPLAQKSSHTEETRQNSQISMHCSIEEHAHKHSSGKNHPRLANTPQHTNSNKQRKNRMKQKRKLESTDSIADVVFHTKRKQSERFNTLLIYGKPQMDDRPSFVSLCRKTGILIKDRDIIRAQKRGYKGHFDSRHLVVIFINSQVAKEFEQTLTLHQKHSLFWKKTSHKKEYTILLDHVPNRFAPLRLDDALPDHPQELHDTDPNQLQNSIIPDENRNDHSISPKGNKSRCQYWRVCTYNIQSLNNKRRLKQLSQFVQDHDIDLLAVQETNWKGGDLPRALPGFTWYGSKAKRKQGGVGFFIKSNLLDGVKIKAKEGKHSKDTLFLILERPNMRTTCFMNVYGKSSPSAEQARDQWSSFTVDLHEVLTKTAHTTDVVFLGDINARIGRASNSDEEQLIGKYGEHNNKRNLSGSLAIDFFRECRLTSLNARQPSTDVPLTFHSRAQGHSLIDIIAVSSSMYRREYEAHPIDDATLTGKEDHLPVIANLRLKRRKQKPKKRVPREVWNMAAMDSENKTDMFFDERDAALTQLIANCEAKEETEHSYTAETLLKRTVQIIVDSAKKHIGKKRVFYKYHTSRTMKKEKKLRKRIKTHTKLHKSQIRNPQSAAFKTLQKMKNELSELQKKLAKERERYLDRAITKSFETNDSRKLTRLVCGYEEGTSDCRTDSIGCVKDSDDIMRTNDESIRKVFHCHWKKMFDHEQDAEDLENFEIKNEDLANDALIYNKPISTNEVQEALRKMKNGKAFGLDDLPREFLRYKKGFETTPKVLALCFNKIMQTGEFPKGLKIDRRVPIFKTGGDPTCVNDYRLLAVHSVLRKILCNILETRIRSIIKLDDSQNGFRRGRRGTDNVLILNNVIRQMNKNSGGQVIVVDFSKAFDRCHIATLLGKLARKGVNGKLLRVIKNMYTEAEAKLIINGKLSEPFKVTRGVAQGCPLSPLFFDIYIDDLLTEFREQELGVPIGQLLQGPESFADDLALIAEDQKMSERYIKLLEEWCQNNFFKINDSKSGILRVGKEKKLPVPQIQINGNRIHLLNEQDPDREAGNIDELKYLGILIDQDGSCNKFHESKIKKGKQAFGRFWRFLKYANASVKLKLRVAHSLIFSHLSYGYDIMDLSLSQVRQVNQIHAIVLRTILQLPKHTSYNTMLYITGETQLAALLTAGRINNLQRIRHLPVNTQLRKLYEQKTWHTRGFIFKMYEDDLLNVKKHLRLTSTTEEDFKLELNKAPSHATKKFIKQVCFEMDQAALFHLLRLKHNELLEGFHSSKSAPFLEQSSLRISNYAKWLAGTSNAKGDLPDFKNTDDKECRLCENHHEETRTHLLTDCLGTQDLRVVYHSKIMEISKQKAKELEALPPHRQWMWILGAGTIREEEPDPINNNRIHRIQAGISAGRNVTPVKDKTNENECLDSYYEYLNIVHGLEPEHIRIYTDGSHCPKTRRTGYGIRIIHHSLGREKVIHESSTGLGEATINEAELTSVHDAMRWLIHEGNEEVPHVPIHIFTDSKYTYNASTSTQIRRTNFHLVQEIQNYGHRLTKLFDIPRPSMHYVPSHIEQTSQGFKRTGNFYADQLATTGRNKSGPNDKSKYLHVIRNHTLSATIDLIDSIEELLQKEEIEKLHNSDGPSASADDLSAKRSCRPGSPSSENPVT